jgi:hypothetical protein
MSCRTYWSENQASFKEADIWLLFKKTPEETTRISKEDLSNAAISIFDIIDLPQEGVMMYQLLEHLGEGINHCALYSVVCCVLYILSRVSD